MISVLVTYTVSKEYVFRNKENIALFLEDFKDLDNTIFRYSIYEKNNEGTFVHFSEYQNEEIQKQLLSIQSFVAFQAERDKNLVSKPTVEVLKKVGQSGNFSG